MEMIIKAKIEDYEYKFDIYYDGVLHETTTVESLQKTMRNMIQIPVNSFKFEGYNE